MAGSSGSITLTDVAKHAGVSLATASRALNGSQRTVNAELKERVLASAAALRYSANVQAQAVARGSSRTVALVIGDIADPYFSSIASGVVHEAAERRLIVTMATTGADAESEVATVAALTGQRPRVLIMASSRRVDLVTAAADDSAADAAADSTTADTTTTGITRDLAAIESTGGSVAFIGSGLRGFRTVAIHNREGASDLAGTLVERGYRDFAVLAGPDDLVTARERSSGFVDALAAQQITLDDDRIVHGEFSRDGGYRSMLQLLACGARPACVFAVTDVMAVGAMAALRERGIEPGGEIGVAGFDDIQMLQDLTPSLTTVALPLAAMGAQALRLALDEPDAAAPVVGRLVLRDSTPGINAR